MAQASANREPTMEEILASIRRIIENNDTGEDTGAAHHHAGEDADMRFAAALDDDAEDGEVTSMPGGAEAEYAAAPAARGAEMPSRAAVSLAEVAARVRASGAGAQERGVAVSSVPGPVHGNVAVRLEEEPETPEQDVAAPDVSVDADAEPVVETVAGNADSAVEPVAEFDTGMAEPSAEDRHASEPFVQEAEPDDGEEEPGGDVMALESELRSVLHSAAAVAPVTVEDAADRPMRQESGLITSEDMAVDDAAGKEAPVDEIDEKADAATGTHLMSATAGAKVAAAFDDLNDAFQAGPRRSFDEIAEEMLRPMLQQWLDDNLPTLVERLVREEIERVARGGRR